MLSKFAVLLHGMRESLIIAASEAILWNTVQSVDITALDEHTIHTNQRFNSIPHRESIEKCPTCRIPDTYDQR